MIEHALPKTTGVKIPSRYKGRAWRLARRLEARLASMGVEIRVELEVNKYNLRCHSIYSPDMDYYSTDWKWSHVVYWLRKELYNPRPRYMPDDWEGWGDLFKDDQEEDND